MKKVQQLVWCNNTDGLQTVTLFGKSEKSAAKITVPCGVRILGCGYSIIVNFKLFSVKRVLINAANNKNPATNIWVNLAYFWKKNYCISSLSTKISSKIK